MAHRSAGFPLMMRKAAWFTSWTCIPIFSWALCFLAGAMWEESELVCAWEVCAIISAECVSLGYSRVAQQAALLLLTANSNTAPVMCVSVVGTLSSSALIRDKSGVLYCQQLSALFPGTGYSRWQSCWWGNLHVWTWVCSGIEMQGTFSVSWALPAAASSLPSFPRSSLLFCLGKKRCSSVLEAWKNISKIGNVSAFLYMFQFFLAVYSARRSGSYYIKMLFLVINPRHGGCSWHFPPNLLLSLVNSYLVTHSHFLYFLL